MRNLKSCMRLVLFALVSCGYVQSAHAGVTATPANWLNPASGVWTDAAKWSTSPTFPNNGAPNAGDHYDALIAAIGSPYTVTLNTNVGVDSLTLDSPDATLLHTEGKLTASFAIKKLSAETVGFKGGYVLLAIPKEPTPAYQTMMLYVDGKTFQVRRVLLIDAQKNKNVFDFSEPVVNLPVPPSEFQFSAPAGTQVIKP